MLTLQEFHQILKSHQFKSEVVDSVDSYIFTFTEIHVFRDGQPLCFYELVQDNLGFKFAFSHLTSNLSTIGFKNVTIVVDDDNRFPIVVNSYSGKGFDITLVAK